MPITCETWIPTQVDRVRFTLTNNCGAPIYGPVSTWVTDMPMSFQVTRNMNEPEGITQSLPDGRICWSRVPPPQLLNHTLTIAYCGIDPAMMVALNEANSPVHDYLFNVVGWDETNRTSDHHVAVEAWMARPVVNGNGCGDAENPIEGKWSYMGFYNVTPFVETGDVTYGTEAVPYTIVATAQVGSGWGRGPYDVQLNPGAPPTPGPWITPVDASGAKRTVTVDVAPPEPTCGPLPLSNPNAPLVFVRPGANSMEICVSVLTDTGDWVVDFGDGSPTQQFGADEEVCYQYTEEGCYNIGVHAVNNEQLFRGEHICLPQRLTLDIEPNAGPVPLDVLATIGGASGTEQPIMDWGD